MSFLDPIRNAIFKPARDRVWGRLETNQVPAKIRIEPKSIEPNEVYLNIVLRSMRIVNVRVAFSRLYGLVHSFITLPIYATEDAKFNVVTTPSNLKDIDARRLDRVIQGDKELLGPVPYRGGKVELEIGLFAVKSEDLLDKYLSLLSELADAAGVNYIRHAIPFVGPIQKGISMLLGVEEKSNILVGLQHAIDPIAGHYVITDADINSSFDLGSLKLGDDYRLYKKNGDPFRDNPYMVFSVYSTPKRHTWFDIPELGTAFHNLLLAIRSGSEESIKENYDIFEKAVLSSPDLLIQDAQEIVDGVYKKHVRRWVKPKKLPSPQLILPEVSPETRTAEAIAPELLALINIPKMLSAEDRKVAVDLKIFDEDIL